MKEIIEYLKILVKIKRNFADSVDATDHAEKFTKILSDLDEAEAMLKEGELARAKKIVASTEKSLH